MKPFGGIPPDVPLVDKVGKIVREWWRWANNVQQVTDGGNSGTMADLLTLEFVQPPRDDVPNEIQQLQAIVQSMARPRADVASLIDEIRTIVMAIPKPPVPDAVIDYDGPRGRDYDRTLADMQAWLGSLPQVKQTELWQAGSVYDLGDGLNLNQGTLSAFGGSTSVLWNYHANTAITVGPPPSGDVYWNNATQTSATIVGLSHLTFDGFDIDVFLARIVTGNIIVIQDANDSTNFQVWTVSGAITIHANSYVEVPVTLSSSGGTGTTNFPNNHALFVALFTSGGGSSVSITATGSGVAVNPSPITGTGTISVEWNAGTVTALDPSITIASNTIAVASTYATQSYVNTQIGLSNNEMMASAATTTTLPTNTYNNGTAGVGATLTATANGALVVDGVTLNASDLVLVKNEATAANNGLYVVTATGGVGAPYVLTRWNTFNQSSNINAPFYAIEVRGGTVNANTQWVVSANVANVGTSAINFSEWGLWQAAQVTGLGAGLTNSGGTLNATGVPSVVYSFVQNRGFVNAATLATSGQICAFEATDTIVNTYWPTDSVVNNGSYISQICPLNASNVVQAVNTSGTVVTTGTLGQMLKFSFGAGIAVNTGTNYAISISRLDGGTTAVVQIWYSTNTGRAAMRNMPILGVSPLGIFQNAVTAITNGMTLGGTATGYYSFGMDKAL